MAVALWRFLLDWFEFEKSIVGFSIVRLVLDGVSDVSLVVSGDSAVRPLALNVVSGVSAVSLGIHGVSQFRIQVGPR